jgi:hypothetical protein
VSLLVPELSSQKFTWNVQSSNPERCSSSGRSALIGTDMRYPLQRESVLIIYDENVVYPAVENRSHEVRHSASRNQEECRRPLSEQLLTTGISDALEQGEGKRTRSESIPASLSFHSSSSSSTNGFTVIRPTLADSSQSI